MTTTTNGKRPAVFIDRDGTLIEEVNFLSRVEDLKLFAFTAAAVTMLKDAGYLVIVVTNQSGIGRGIYTIDDMHSVHDAIQTQLGGAIDAFYFCPHLPTEGCECRKPGLGMIHSAISNFDIEMPRSWFVGDKKSDVETGMNARIRSSLVLTGYGRSHLPEIEFTADFVGDDLFAVAEHIVGKRD